MLARSWESQFCPSVRPSVRLSVCHSHTRALWLIQRTYRRYFYTTWKGNPSSQMWFFVQLCSSWHYFNWLKASRRPSAIAELLLTHSVHRLGGNFACDSEHKVCSSMPNVKLTDLMYHTTAARRKKPCKFGHCNVWIDLYLKAPIPRKGRRWEEKGVKARGWERREGKGGKGKRGQGMGRERKKGFNLLGEKPQKTQSWTIFEFSGLL